MTRARRAQLRAQAGPTPYKTSYGPTKPSSWSLVVSGHQLGGAVVAHHTARAELEARILEDPFVAHDVVKPEVLEVSPSKAAPRLAFLFE